MTICYIELVWLKSASVLMCKRKPNLFMFDLYIPWWDLHKFHFRSNISLQFIASHQKCKAWDDQKLEHLIISMKCLQKIWSFGMPHTHTKWSRAASAMFKYGMFFEARRSGDLRWKENMQSVNVWSKTNQSRIQILICQLSFQVFFFCIFAFVNAAGFFFFIALHRVFWATLSWMVCNWNRR